MIKGVRPDSAPARTRVPVGAMLLNEVQKQHSTIAEQAARLEKQAAEIAGQQAALRELTLRLEKLEKRP